MRLYCPSVNPVYMQYSHYSHYRRPRAWCATPPSFLPLLLAIVFFPGFLTAAFFMLSLVVALVVKAAFVFTAFHAIASLFHCAPCAFSHSCATKPHESSKPAASKQEGRHAEEEPYSLTVLVPGIQKSDLSVTTDGSVLHVKGVTETAHGAHSADEQFVLPLDADLDRATVEHRDGTLSVTIPKRVSPTMRRVAVKTTKLKDSAGPAPSEPAPKPVAALKAGRAVVAASKALEKTQASEVSTASTAEPLLEEREPDVANVQLPNEKTDEAVLEAEGGEEEEESEWDEMLEDLDDMGFGDRERNRELLEKHGGSVKAAVKELVAEAKASL